MYSGNGLSFYEMEQMDLADYREAVEAKILYNEMVETEQKRREAEGR